MTLARHNPRRDGNESVITDYLTSLGYAWWTLSGKGIPDIMVLDDAGQYRLLEVKTSDGKLTPDQRRFFDECHTARHLYIVRNIADLEFALEPVNVT